MLSFYHGLRVGTDKGFQQSLQSTEGTATDSRSHSDIQVAASTQIEHPLRQFSPAIEQIYRSSARRLTEDECRSTCRAERERFCIARRNNNMLASRTTVTISRPDPNGPSLRAGTKL